MPGSVTQLGNGGGRIRSQSDWATHSLPAASEGQVVVLPLPSLPAACLCISGTQRRVRLGHVSRLAEALKAGGGMSSWSDLHPA